MLPAVQFHDQPRRVAVEVGDVRSDRVLPAEAMPAQTLAAQEGPDPPLGVGAGLSQLAGELDESSVGHRTIYRYSFSRPHPCPPPEYRERERGYLPSLGVAWEGQIGSPPLPVLRGRAGVGASYARGAKA